MGLRTESLGGAARFSWTSWIPPRDPRTADWPFIGNLPFVLMLTLGYCYIVKVAGPRWMADRPAFNVKPLVQLYNISMVLFNLAFMIQFLRHSYLGGGYNIFCQGMTHSTDENSMKVLSLCYWYFWVRVGDFLDTLFFLLHKKFSHITTLHYTHHALVVWSGWLWLTYGADGQTLLGLIVNSGIHVVMYTYYFLAALGPHMQPYLWWKKYITKAQITQFVFLMIHILIPLVYDCGYPKGMIYLAFSQGALGLTLFINFYIQSYIKKEPRKEVRDNEAKPIDCQPDKTVDEADHRKSKRA
ncbi:elongation of very long chain fatty acids protein AAEL008004 [Galendromus occidentalis]|uniref:Elongation of very long chain fatty acids protein n=1 Tax=Galendromus occidentalis TaxID=34638 RepID=A0AAJ7L5A3_9ACAR|nr:elongation of very long chain fatty acids protein AAEL008004 [Galendromus occidentalis]